MRILCSPVNPGPLLRQLSWEVLCNFLGAYLAQDFRKMSCWDALEYTQWTQSIPTSINTLWVPCPPPVLWVPFFIVLLSIGGQGMGISNSGIKVEISHPILRRRSHRTTLSPTPYYWQCERGLCRLEGGRRWVAAQELTFSMTQLSHCGVGIGGVRTLPQREGATSQKSRVDLQKNQPQWTLGGTFWSWSWVDHQP